MNDRENYEIKLADGRKIRTSELSYTSLGIKFPLGNGLNRFVPYAAILWVDYRI